MRDAAQQALQADEARVELGYRWLSAYSRGYTVIVEDCSGVLASQLKRGVGRTKREGSVRGDAEA